MAKKNSLIRKKLNQKEIEEKIDADFRRKFSFFFDGKNKIEFILPEENHDNTMLFLNIPLQKITHDGKFSKDGEFGKLKIFYFDSNLNDKLHSLFKEFYIPENLYQDLTVAFLCMVIASTESRFSDEHHRQQKKNIDEFISLMEILKDLSEHKYAVRDFDLNCSEILKEKNPNGSPKLGKPKLLHAEGALGLNFLRGILNNFENAKEYESFKSMYNYYKEHGTPDLNAGHKNTEKSHQSYYAGQIFEYLRRLLFRPVNELCTQETFQEYQNEFRKLKKKYPRSKIYLFIGRLMHLSGLLKAKEKNSDDEIAEVIEKKIAPRLRSEKKRDQLIDEHNAKIANGQDVDTNFMMGFE